MNFNKFTIKSQEAIQKAQQIAMGMQHQQIENSHVLKAIFEVDENVSDFLFKKVGVNTDLLKKTIDKTLESYAKVSGGDPTLSRNASRMLNKAEQEKALIESRKAVAAATATAQDAMEKVGEGSEAEKRLAKLREQLRSMWRVQGERLSRNPVQHSQEMRHAADINRHDFVPAPRLDRGRHRDLRPNCGPRCLDQVVFEDYALEGCVRVRDLEYE